MLGAVEHPVAAGLLHRRRLHPAYVRTRIRLGHGQRVHALTTHGGEQVFVALLPLAGHQDVLRPAPEVGQRHRPAPQLAFEQGKGQVIQTTAADFLGEVRGIEAHVQHLLLQALAQFLRHVAELFDLVFVRVDFGFDEGPDGIHHHFLLGGKAELHFVCPLFSGG